MPEQVTLDADEAYRINRARLAIKLHKLPHELDAMPLLDMADLVEVMKADDKLAELEAARQRAQAKRRRT
jgi:hypothetical protein